MLSRELSPAPRAASAPAKPSAELFLAAPLQPVPGISSKLLSCCPLPLELAPQRLLRSFRAAPQFSDIRPEELLSRRRGCLRVILLSAHAYYARQCALYLAALSARENLPQSALSRKQKEEFWAGADLRLPAGDGASAPRETGSREELLLSALAVVSAQALDPGLSPESVLPGAEASRPRQCLQLSSLSSPAALIWAEEGQVLSSAVLDQLHAALVRRGPQSPMDLFLALTPGQEDWAVIEELRFTHGFQVCPVGEPDPAYLRRVLQAEAEELLLPIGGDVELDRVIAHTRQLRGEAFSALDLRSLVHWAVQNEAQPPLTEADLLFLPYAPKAPAQKELERMVGLAPVKDAIRRLLASARLDLRRRRAGREVAPVCRNLAFSGPPGTGKSVTARLLARIMQEAGCGSGRFVEAGREQLIGSYLGQTSPMVAKAFQQARGGVLFIDEAGALLSGGDDIYAAEAVNALVRHMELSPETLVIFATYPGEMERLLSSNPGLSSRVAQVLDFCGYDDGQLWDILGCFAEKEGYDLPAEARPVCDGFFHTLRQSKGEHFGNGREARRLFRAAVEELALRLDSSPDAPERLLPQDLALAARHLLDRPGTQPRRTIGF